MRRVWIAGVLLVAAGALALWIALRRSDERASVGLAPRAELAPEVAPAAPPVELPEAARATAAPSPIVEKVLGPELHTWRARAIGRVLDYASGAPVAGAAVEFETYDEDGSASARTASSDAQGRFELDGLHLRSGNPPRDELSFAVRAPGYVSYFAYVYDRTHQRPRDPSETLELAVGDLRLSRGTLVAGRVVRAADGAGVEGATIHFGQLRPVQEGIEGVARFTNSFLRELGVSGAEGRFDLREPVTALSSEAYLFAWSEQGVGWAKIAVVEGLARIEDVELRLDQPHALAVEVVDARGEAVRGAEVYLTSLPQPLRSLARLAVHPRAEGSLAFARMFRGRTDEQGGWRAAPLPAPSRGDDWELTVRADDGRGTSMPVSLGAPNAPPVRVVVPDLASAEARTIAARVVDPDGYPFAGVRVQLDGRAVTTDADGRFRIELATGRERHVLLLVSGAGIAGGYTTVRAEDFGNEELELVFRHAAPIAGLVTDQAGRALAGVELSLEPIDRTLRRPATWTDAHGRFRIEDAPEGEWQLVGPDALPGNREPLNAIAVRGGDEDVHFVCDMQSDATGRLALRVVDGITGAPRAPLAVMLTRWSAEGRESLFMPEVPLTRTLGRVTVEDLPAGSWRVDVRVEDGGWSMIRIEVGAGALTEAQMLVGLGGAVAGRVRAEASLEGAWVAVESNSGNTRPPTGGLRRGARAGLDPATGRFRLDGLDPGDYTLTLESSALSARATATVLAGEEAQVELDTRVPARLRIVSAVPWEGGGLRVRVWTDEIENAHVQEMLATGAPVDFEVGVGPGHVRWELDALASSDSPRVGAPPARWSGEATLSAGEEHTVRLDAPR